VGAQRGYGLAGLAALWRDLVADVSGPADHDCRPFPEPETQRRAFAINFTTQNAALGLGSTVGAIVASVHHPGTFQALFLANAASCLLFAVALPFLPSLHRPRGADEPRAGYRDVLASRALRLMLVASLLIYFTGYPAFEPGLPAYATVEAHVSAHIVALSLTVNTAVIVATQLIVLRLVRRLRPSRALALVGLIWAASWTVFGLAALPIPLASRVAFVFTFTALFGLGETFVAPTLGPLLNTWPPTGSAAGLTRFPPSPNRCHSSLRPRSPPA
jgi:predicted MFS family arabinose efflux permease